MSEEVVDTPFGKFLINPQDCIGTTLKAGTLWDGPGFLQPIALEYGRLGTPRTTILDIGANIGSFAVWLARHGAWRVIAVEPIPETMQRLKANLDLNRDVTADVVIPLEIAAYDFVSGMGLAAAYNPDNMGATALVPLVGGAIIGQPLDAYAYLFADAVSLIKIDAQGCDGRAIYGLADTITRDHPAIVFEWEAEAAAAHRLTLTEVRQWLEAKGYQVYPWPSQPNNFLARWTEAEKG